MEQFNVCLALHTPLLRGFEMWPHDIFPEPRGLALRRGMAGVARTAAPAATAAATSSVSGLAGGSALPGGGQGFCFQDDFMPGGS